MNVTRRTATGLVDPEEPTPQELYITSAGSKATFAYERLIELLTMEIIDPSKAFVFGSGYELPVYYGLLNKNYLDEQKMSKTFSAAGFARESMSIWTGGNSDSWFNPIKLVASRSLLKCERAAKPDTRYPDMFYMMGIDVARTGNNDTSIMVVKVIPRKDNAPWIKRVVYTENLTKMSFPMQSRRIKELYTLYQPREVVVDSNGIGSGLVDELTIPSLSSKGEVQPPLYVMNDPETYPTPPDKRTEAVLYSMKANAEINSEMYSNLYIQFNSGNLLLLADEKIVKEKLLTTKKG